MVNWLEVSLAALYDGFFLPRGFRFWREFRLVSTALPFGFTWRWDTLPPGPVAAGFSMGSGRLGSEFWFALFY